MERYEAYRDSGIEWIGEIPERWTADKVVRLFAVIGSGTTPRTDVEAYYDGDIPWVQSGDLGEWMITGTSKTVTEDAIRNTSALVLYEAPFIAIAMYGASIGNMSIIEVDSCVNQACCVLSNCKAVMRYYAYALDSAKRYLIDHGIGGTQPNISQQVIRGLWLPQPSIHEQRAIADYLDAKTAEIDALVADCEREVGLLREYRKAVISEAVTKGLDPDAPMRDSGVEWIGEIPERWDVVGFKTYLNGIVDYRGRTPEKVDDGVFLITGRNIKQGRIHYELSQEYMRREDYDTIMSRGRLKVGNVLFTMEAPLGEAALIDRNDCAAAQRIIQLCCNEDELFGAFLVYWIMSNEFQSNLQTYATGSTASGIKASKLGMLRLMHPPMEAQHSIVDYLNAKTAEIDSLIDAKQQMADKLREYRKSLISEAVTGKFKVPGV